LFRSALVSSRRPPALVASAAAGAIRQPASVGGPMPKLWLYTQIAIIVFVLAGMVIAVTKLV
jgi:hypothetical protein